MAGTLPRSSSSPSPIGAASVNFGPALSAPQTPHTYHTVEDAPRRRVTQDMLTGKMTVDFPRWTYAKTMPDIGQTQSSKGFVRHEVTDGDPTTAAMITDYQVTMQFPDVTIHHHSTGRMSCTTTHFRVQMHVVLHQGEEVVFERAWDEEIARDMV